MIFKLCEYLRYIQSDLKVLRIITLPKVSSLKVAFTKDVTFGLSICVMPFSR